MKMVLWTAALAFCIVPAVAQEWARIRKPIVSPSSRFAPIEYDAARGRSILFGGTFDSTPDPSTVPIGEQWEFDGNGWAQAFPRTLPPARYQHAMCYDSLRQRVLLFGGRSVPYVDRDDLWAFDGTNWTQLSPAQSPPARRSPAMAYDSARDRVVLFGGIGAVYHDDTWEFDGTSWLQVPALGPTERSAASMAFDPLRSVCVLSGGYNPGATGMDTTWEYDGSQWQMGASEGMSGQFGFDANVGRVVSPTAQWTGQSWVAIASAWNYLPASQLVFDSQRGVRVLFAKVGGKVLATVETGDTWSAAGDPPGGQSLFDSVRSRLLGFGRIIGRGTDNIWSWNGQGWDPLGYGQAFCSSLSSLRLRAFDPVRDLIYQVAVGGSGFASIATYRGGDFQPLGVAPTPILNGSGHVAISYDIARDRLVALNLVVVGSSLVMKTFEFDGANWQENVSASHPAPRAQFSVVYEPVRQRCVMTGGWPGVPETWEYDGIDWVQRPIWTPALPLTPRLVFDATHSRIVAMNSPYVWEYDGTAWALAATLTSPKPERLLGWDPVRGRLLALGEQADCCTYESADGTAAAINSYGMGCTASTSALLSLRTDTAPILGRELATRLVGLPPEHGLALQMVGFDDQALGGASLPLPLSPLGGSTDCDLVLAPAFAEVLSHQGSTQRFTVLLPNAAALAGATFFLQGAVYDPMLQVSVPFATSNGLRCTAGL